jgi:hypothetical protein
MTPNAGRIEDLVMRMQGAFLASPALTLTLPSAERRFDADHVTCDAVLGVLVDAKVLTKRPDGSYARFFPRMASAAHAA